MSDITQIQIGNTTYDINDAYARSKLIPSGGTTGQVLKKKSETNYDVEWGSDESGSGAYTVSTETIGSASAGTNITADDITSWSAGTLPSCSVSNEVLIFSFGSLPVLAYTEKSIPNISVTSKTVVTSIT